MLKLDKSTTYNNIALHLATTESLSDVAFVYSQSYDLSNGVFSGDVTGTKGKYRIVEILGQDLPTPSGQYDITIYKGESQPITWASANFAYNNNPYRWNDIDDATPVGEALRTIRAWISGSNDVSFTEYASPNELGTYTTYNS